jgi:class 3 adenylate cyclase
VAGLPVGTLTFLLTDLESSTQAWEAEPDAMREAMGQHDALVYSAVKNRSGSMVETGREGDSVLAVFERATDAAACALEIQGRFRSAAWPDKVRMRVRIALHTGEAELRGGHYLGPSIAVREFSRSATAARP